MLWWKDNSKLSFLNYHSPWMRITLMGKARIWFQNWENYQISNDFLRSLFLCLENQSNRCIFHSTFVFCMLEYVITRKFCLLCHKFFICSVYQTIHSSFSNSWICALAILQQHFHNFRIILKENWKDLM